MSKAAKTLNKTRAAVSHSIMVLENNIKLPLFIRTTRRIKLTQAGLAFYEQCLRLDAEVKATQHLLEGIHDVPVGKLKIMISKFYTDDKFIELLSLYHQHYPDVDVEIVVDERMPNMKEEEVDVVFGVSWPTNDGDIVRKKITDTQYVFCASPDYLSKKGYPETLSQLSHHSYIAHGSRTRPIVKLKDKTTPGLTIHFQTNDADFMRRLALNHQGIIQVHDYLVREDLQAGRLIEILPNLTKPTSLYIYYLRDRYVQPKIRQFLTCYESVYIIS